MKKRKAIIMMLASLFCLTACVSQPAVEEKNENVESNKESTALEEADPEESIAESTEAKADSKNDNWKEVYKKYLTDILEDKEYLSSFYDAYPYSETKKAFFLLQDITGDDVPELWLSSDEYQGEYEAFLVFTAGEDNNVKRVLPGEARAAFYDSDKKEVYAHDGSLNEDYELIKNEAGEFAVDFVLLWDPDEQQYSKGTEYENCEAVSMEEGQELDAKYQEAKKKYAVKNAIALNPENLEKELSN